MVSWSHLASDKKNNNLFLSLILCQKKNSAQNIGSRAPMPQYLWEAKPLGCHSTPSPLSPPTPPKKSNEYQQLSALYSCEKSKNIIKTNEIWFEKIVIQINILTWNSNLCRNGDHHYERNPTSSQKYFYTIKKMIFLVVLLLWNGNETAHATQGKQIFENIRKKMYSS